VASKLGRSEGYENSCAATQDELSISLADFKVALEQMEFAQRKVRWWRGRRMRQKLKKVFETTKKWIRRPTDREIEWFLKLTNGKKGRYEKALAPQVMASHLSCMIRRVVRLRLRNGVALMMRAWWEIVCGF
jgi:hypothetical protein